MIPALILAAIGALVGWTRATSQGGTNADRWQYAAAHGIAMFLIGIVFMIVAARMGWLSA